MADRSAALAAAIARNPKMPLPQAEYGFYLSLKPLEGAVSAVKRILKSKRYSPYILTAPSLLNPMSYTEKRVWVETHFGLEMARRLIISLDKSLLKGDVLIDDRNRGHGQECFEGTLLRFGSDEFPSWSKAILHLDACHSAVQKANRRLRAA